MPWRSALRIFPIQDYSFLGRWHSDAGKIISCVRFRLLAFGDNGIDNAGKFLRVPMPSRFPPLLQSGIGNEIGHRPLDLPPGSVAEETIAIMERSAQFTDFMI